MFCLKMEQPGSAQASVPYQDKVQSEDI